MSDSTVERTPTVLSIQSHVVHGHVGNRASVFPLQVMGFEVDTINTVSFSNHTGYPTVKGTRLTGEELRDVVSGLDENGIAVYDYLLTGYVGTASALRALIDVAKLLRERNPKLVWVCDPVMGDRDFLYVPKELVEIYRDEVVVHADFVTPNLFECKLLTGKDSVKSNSEIASALDALHAKGLKTVVVTSLDETNGTLPVLFSRSAVSTQGTASESESESVSERFIIDTPHLNYNFTGTGDVFTALLLGYTHKNGDLRTAGLFATSAMNCVLRRTAKHIDAVMAADPSVQDDRKRKVAARELRLIQSLTDFLTPQAQFEVRDLV